MHTLASSMQSHLVTADTKEQQVNAVTRSYLVYLLQKTMSVMATFKIVLKRELDLEMILLYWI